MHIQTGELVFGLLVKRKHNPTSWENTPPLSPHLEAPPHGDPVEEFTQTE